MANKMVFKRYELKYMLTRGQKEALLREMEPYMRLDIFGHTTIRNVYFDTDNYRLIRSSLEKPAYKEKLRIRSYSRANPDSRVFVELKKKYKSVVYKRREEMTEQSALQWLCGGVVPEPASQIAREIEYFRGYYKDLVPKVFLSYEREAYFEVSGGDFRVTFDENIRARTDELSLEAGVHGRPLLEDGMVLMELKTSGSIPLWMADFLDRERIFKTSFSKYGTAYNNIICTDKGDAIYA